MIDLSHLVNSQSADVQTYTIPSTVNNTQWHTWNKPRGASMCYMICIGGGGGGGASTSTTSSGAGGGGSSAGQSTILIPAILIPDQLFIQIGAGGAGGASSSASGGAG